MAGYSYAFAMSAEEVREATPPGTVTLSGKKPIASRCTFLKGLI